MQTTLGIRWNVYANFTYVDATFLNSLVLSSPNNPFADANGNIFVTPGDHLTGIPDFRFKLGAEYQVNKPWKIGADLNVIGGQWIVGDESNQLPKMPAYWVVNLHSSYKITDDVEVFGLVRNLFDQHYYVYGTLFETDSFPYLNLTDPRTFVPGMPFAAYVGVRGTLPSSAQPVAAITSKAYAPIPVKAPPHSRSPVQLDRHLFWRERRLQLWNERLDRRCHRSHKRQFRHLRSGVRWDSRRQLPGRTVRCRRRSGRRLDRCARLRHLHCGELLRRRLLDQQQLAGDGTRAAPAMHSTRFSSTAPAARHSATSAPISPTIRSAARPKPAGPSAPASRLRWRRTGPPRRNICLSIWATASAWPTAPSSIRGPLRPFPTST